MIRLASNTSYALLVSRAVNGFEYVFKTPHFSKYNKRLLIVREAVRLA